MEDQTTTGDASVDDGGQQPQVINGVAVDDQGQALPVPENTEAATTAAEASSDEQSTDEVDATSGASEEAVPGVDDKLRKYAESNSITLDSPGAIKAAELAMKAQSEATRNYQKASELERAAKITNDQIPDDIEPEARDNVRVRNLELKFEAQNWKLQNPDKAVYESDMANILANDPVKRQLVQEGYLSLDDVYSIARGKSSTSDVDLKSQGKREALESLRDKQQAAVPGGKAVNSVPTQEASITPQNVDKLVGQNSLEWFNKNKDAINRAMAG